MKISETDVFWCV